MFINFTDKQKKICSAILILNSLGAGYFGYSLYMDCFSVANGIVVDGAPYLPEYYITNEHFTSHLFLSACGCCLITILGIIASICKKP